MIQTDVPMITMLAEHKHVLISNKTFNVQMLEQVLHQKHYAHGVDLPVLMQLILQNLHKLTVYQNQMPIINGHLTANVFNVVILYHMTPHPVTSSASLLQPSLCSFDSI
jgi:hypothetical protein